MEFSQIFGFLKIFSKSIKLILKNGKSMASITAVSLLLSSFLFLLFGLGYQSALTYVNNSIIHSTSAFTILQIILCFALIFSVELCFLLAYFAITHASGIATILAAAASYSDTKLSLQDLFSMVKTKWRSPFTRNNLFRRSPPKTTLLLGIVAVAVAVAVLVMFHPNPITITIVSVVGVSLLVFQLYASVVRALATVIPVMEDGCEAAEATERAEKLVRGQRLHGFMVNLFLNVIGSIILLSLWMIVGYKGGLNLLVFGLFFVNTISLSGILVSVLYTVYYFQCKEYHGQKIQLSGNFNYTTLPLNGIP